MSRYFGIEWAPLCLPWKRRRETLAVVYYISSMILIPLIFSSLYVYIFFTKVYYISIAYTIWMLIDCRICRRGGRRVNWVRRWRVWTWFADYFPITLVKTVDLDNSKNYIFGVHPHGTLIASGVINFSTEGTGFSEKFPGLVPHLLTLDHQYWCPFSREWFLCSGACSSAKSSMEWILSRKGKGQVLALIVGGSDEVMETSRGRMDLILNKRKGFIKLAIRFGASLVPVVSFGENDLHNYTRPEHSVGKPMTVSEYLRIPLRLCTGRGIFQYTFGILPHRRPIYTVVGKPIDVERNENPTREDVQQLHSVYVEKLTELFELNKYKYGHEGVRINIVQ